MPYKDPATGCTVMTLMEFFASEAAKKDIEPKDEIQNFFAEIEGEEKIEADRLKIPSEAMEFFKNSFKEFYGTDEPEFPGDFPKEVLEVIDVKVTFSLRKCFTSVSARCTDHYGKIGVWNCTGVTYSGTYLDPPDFDISMGWESVEHDFDQEDSLP